MILSDTLIKYTGRIVFEVPNVTKKHEKQADWKKVVLIDFDNQDIGEYYSWFLKRRFNLKLNRTLRNTHCTLINDYFIRDCFFEISDEEKEVIWEQVKEKYDGKEIDVVLNINKYHFTKEHVYLIVDNDNRQHLNDIRGELGLGKPYYGYHITIGLIHPHYVEFSEYLTTLHNKNIIELY